jgi:hypothetical protein
MSETNDSTLRRWFKPAAGVLLLAVLAACVTRPSTAAPSIHRAGVVVVHADGTVRKACVRFPESEITGEVLLRRAGLQATVDSANPMGALVCSIDGQGCRFPSQPCFCSCAKLGACAYWAYFIEDKGGGWNYAAQGASARSVHDGDLDGWVWLQTSGAGAPAQSLLPKVGLDDVCPPS